MNSRRLLQQMLSLTLIALSLVGCGGTPVEPTATPTPVPPAVSGQAHSMDDPPRPAPDRKIVLCLVKEIIQEEGAAHAKASCVLDADLTTVTDSEGHFEFQNVPDGSYMLLYDNTVEDFEAGLAEWDGKLVKIGYADQGSNPNSEVTTMVVNEMMPAQNLLLPAFIAAYVVPPGLPFLLSAKIDVEALAFTPVVIEVETGEIAEVDIEVFGSKQQ